VARICPYVPIAHLQREGRTKQVCNEERALSPGEGLGWPSQPWCLVGASSVCETQVMLPANASSLPKLAGICFCSNGKITNEYIDSEEMGWEQAEMWHPHVQRHSRIMWFDCLDKGHSDPKARAHEAALFVEPILCTYDCFHFLKKVPCDRGVGNIVCLHLCIYVYNIFSVCDAILLQVRSYSHKGQETWSRIVTIATFPFYKFLMQGNLTKIKIVNDIRGNIITSWKTVKDHFWLHKIWNIQKDEQIMTNKSLWSSCGFILILKCQHDLFYIWYFVPI
jgi:hypothetical protein